MQSLGQTIKTLRGARGWTLEQLYQVSGVSKGFLSDLENGKRSNVGSSTLLRLADAFGVPVESLMEGGVQVPPDLEKFALEQKLSFAEALTLLKMSRQIHAHRDRARSDDDPFDWKQFYDAVKSFLK
jgi:transcriptional regulator with XRE-family HTH domain